MKAGDGVSGPVDAELEALTVIAEIGRSSEERALPFPAKHLASLGFQFAEHPRDLWTAGCSHHSARELAAQVGAEDAERGERAGRGRDEDFSNAKGRSKSAGMQRACSAKCQ